MRRVVEPRREEVGVDNLSFILKSDRSNRIERGRESESIGIDG